MREWKSLVKQWDIMTFYQRFESVVALFLTLLITWNFVEFTVNFPYAMAKSNFPQ